MVALCVRTNCSNSCSFGFIYLNVFVQLLPFSRNKGTIYYKKNRKSDEKHHSFFCIQDLIHYLCRHKQ